ncbi:hypothetical protein DVR12_06270 [Chitinophaga silvatica]|uniref:Uncharacterized protein n=1 Tax=Chitinophaga silvatica TaxID=2282649 RepID=A0A3E1YE44_9BACT|nr:hypothetical protein [Chitinophaga silvatica]RFS24796.1 hypothetical protein DVR12_06270 [Chitinophaga silvatica]
MKKIYQRLAAVLLIFSACTKTETIPFTPEADNQLLEYKIVNVQGTPIYGAINQADSSVTIYLPFYLQLTILEPELKVSDGATITPASGTMIEDLLDFFRNGRTIKYNVKGKAGNVKGYTLHIQVQQPDLTVKEITTDPANPVTYNIDMKAFFDSFSFTLNGAGFASNLDMIKVVLVDEQNKEYGPLDISQFNTTDLTTLSFSITQYKNMSSAILATLPATGLYKVRIYSYAKVATTQNSIRINLLNK